MPDQELLDSLSDCIDRLAAGQTIEECLAVYPHQAAALRPMLEAGRLAHRARASASEVAQAQDRLRFRVQGQIRRQASRRPPALLRAASSLAALVVLAFGILAVWQIMRDRNATLSPGGATQAVTATLSVTPTETPTASPTATPTAETTPTVQPAAPLIVTAPATPLTIVPPTPQLLGPQGGTSAPGVSAPPGGAPVSQPTATNDHGGGHDGGGSNSSPGGPSTSSGSNSSGSTPGGEGGK